MRLRSYALCRRKAPKTKKSSIKTVLLGDTMGREMERDETTAHQAQALQPVTAQRPNNPSVHESQRMAFELADASAESFDLPSKSCFANYPLQDILLQLGLGHTLKDSRSPLVALPPECLQHVAQHIRALLTQELRESGRSTPVQDSRETTVPDAPRRMAKKMQPFLSLCDAQYASPPFGGGKQGRQLLSFWDFAVPGERADDLFPEM